MLTIKALSHVFDDSPITYPDWEVIDGQHAMILGDSGSGKTTLLHLVGGLLKPSAGDIWIKEDKISEMKPAHLDRYRGENVGIVFQRPHLIAALTVKENLTLAQYLGRKKIDAERVAQILGQLGIEDLKNRKIHQISQGQAQRVSIARAVLNKPKLLLADEPTASLDDSNCEKVIALLKDQAEQNASTLVVATHDHRIKEHFKNRLEL